MKKFYNFVIVVLVSIIFGCYQRDQNPQWFYTKFKPIIMKRSEVEKSIKIVASKPVVSPKKIYMYGKYLFINENQKGVHIFDNSNPSSPINLGFLLIAGNEDIAIKNDVIYADNGTDLVAIEMKDPLNPVVTTRIRNKLTEKLPPDAGQIPNEYTINNRPDETIIMGWE